jgi:amidase
MGGTHNWIDIVSQKRRIRDQLLAPYLVDDIDQRLPQVHNVEERSQMETDPISQKITDIDNIAELLGRIEKGEFGAEEVTLAYIKRYVCSYCQSRSRLTIK